MKLAGLSSSRPVAVALWVTGAAALLSCDARRRNWSTCYQEPCAAGYACNAEHRCVQQGPDAGPLDGREGVDGPAKAEAPAADVPLGIDASAEMPVRE